jgi:hypothetical protein
MSGIAYQSDCTWLLEHGGHALSQDVFSDWVCRLMADGMDENEAREFVLKQMLLNENKGTS